MVKLLVGKLVIILGGAKGRVGDDAGKQSELLTNFYLQCHSRDSEVKETKVKAFFSRF